ncbi:MFS transporter [Paenibacillus albidus]|uniref:MFS transporter n=1 Tax=Paenibacillus albidus TaxID=2041023 RepID=A0A917CD87_9BACL|nr:MFS transporter [Paenibacillus albidus]GGF84533.1 MFS transporter [Paenibacillus albidus]
MFKNQYVRTIILSSMLLQLGIWVRNFAILLYVTELTNNDPFYVSLISVVEFAPIFLFAIIGGTMADRWRPKRTMILSDFLSAISMFAVLVAVMQGSWHSLLAATFISAVLSQFSQPSAMKLFKQHVLEEQLQGVMAVFQSLSAFFMVIGPIAGAYVYGQFGIEISLAVMGVMFIASGLVLTRLPADAQENKEQLQGSIGAEMKAGLNYVKSNAVLRNLGATFAFAGMAAGLIQPLAVFVIIENLGREKEFLQWMLMANGGAMLLGGAVIMGVARKLQPQLLLAAGLLVSAVCTVLVGWSHSTPLTLALQIVSGFIYPCIHVGINTLILRNTQAAYMGRVGGIMGPLFMGMMVVGMTVTGYLKGAFSLFAVYAASGCFFLIGMLLLVPLLKKAPAAQEASRA